MPWTVARPPNPAKHWPEAERHKCVRAANAVLRDGGSDEEAIFACIHAAGHVKTKQGPDKYDQAAEDGALAFQHLVELYYAHEISIDMLRQRFQQALDDHYLRMMLLALDREPTQRDIDVLQRRLDKEYEYLNGFVEDIRTGRTTQQRALWRAGLYGFARAAYINFTIPQDVADLMPVLPGDDCLGGSYCGCGLQLEVDDDGTHYVYWQLDPLKESCPVCIAHAIESPFVFTAEEVANAR